jgi:DNA invertase Pin-like site-specific DNA recombinase
LQRLLDDVQAGKIDCVVVNSLDRLARSSEHAEPLKAIFQRHSVAVLAPSSGDVHIWANLAPYCQGRQPH